MKNAKIVTYLGFCIRARKIIFGVDEIESARKCVHLLIADGGLGASSFKTVVKASQKLACPLLVTDTGDLGEHLQRPAVKAVAIKEKNLAAAILSEAASGNRWKVYSEFNSGGNN